MATMLKIGLDLDGVIIDHTDNKLRLASERGFELEPWQTNSNVMHQFVPEEEYGEIRRLAYNEATIEAEPVEMALESILELPGELYIVSARYQSSVRYAQNWLDQHRIYDSIPAERIFFCSSEAEKKQHCHRLGLQFYLDDKLKVLNSLPFSVRRTLFDNHDISKKLKPGPEIGVVFAWPEFVSLTKGKKG